MARRHRQKETGLRPPRPGLALTVLRALGPNPGLSPEYILGELTAGPSPASHQAAKPLRESRVIFCAKRVTYGHQPAGAVR